MTSLFVDVGAHVSVIVRPSWACEALTTRSHASRGPPHPPAAAAHAAPAHRGAHAHGPSRASSSIGGRRASRFLQVSLSKVPRHRHRDTPDQLRAEALPMNASDFRGELPHLSPRPAITRSRHKPGEAMRQHPLRWRPDLQRSLVTSAVTPARHRAQHGHTRVPRSHAPRPGRCCPRTDGRSLPRCGSTPEATRPGAARDPDPALQPADGASLRRLDSPVHRVSSDDTPGPDGRVRRVAVPRVAGG